MAPKKKELAAELRELGERQDALADALRRLATHTSVLAVAVRDPDAVPPGDLDAALNGIGDITSALLPR